MVGGNSIIQSGDKSVSKTDSCVCPVGFAPKVASALGTQFSRSSLLDICRYDDERGMMMSEKFKVQIDEDLEPIIPAFFSNLEKDIQVAESAISSLDGDEIAKMGHKCKGACGSYGFKDLERLFHDFEEDGKSGRFDDAKIKIQKLRRYIANVEIEYTEIDDEDDDEDAA